MALAHCILGKFLGVGCHCFPPPLDVPTFSARCLHVQWREIPLEHFVGEKCSDKFRLEFDFYVILEIFYMPQICDMGFTSPPKEGVLRIFSSLEIRRLRPGLNPRTWVPKASTLPLDHRKHILVQKYFSCLSHSHTFVRPSYVTLFPPETHFQPPRYDISAT